MKYVGICALALTAGVLLAGCGNAAEAEEVFDGTVAQYGFPIVEEPLRMSMFAPGTGMNAFEDKAFFNAYAAMTGIEWDFTNPPRSDMATRLNLAFASGDIEGVLFGAELTRDMEIQHGGTTLMPLEDYIEAGYMPNFARILEAHPNVRQSITTPDGHIFSLPMLNQRYNVDNPEFAQQAGLVRGSLWFNGSWMEALGIEEEPRTLDEFYEMLIRFRDEDPNGNGIADEIPLHSIGITSLRPWMINAFGLSSIEEQVDDEGNVTFGAATDNFRAYLEFMNHLFNEGLLNNEIFSISQEQSRAMGHNDQFGAFTDWFSFFTTGQTPEEAVINPKSYPLQSEWNPDGWMSTTDGISTGAFAVTNNAQSVPAALRWVDHFFSNDGSMFLNAGPESNEGGFWSWQVSDEGQEVRVLNPELVESDANIEEVRGSVTPDFGMVVPKVMAPSAVILTDRNDLYEQDTFGQFIDEQAARKVGPHMRVGFPTLYLSNEQQQSLGATLRTDLTSFVEQMEARFIVGQEPITDETWESFQATLRQIGVEQFVEVMQEAYDNWSNN